MIYWIEAATFLGSVLMVICLILSLRKDLKGYEGRGFFSDWSANLESSNTDKRSRREFSRIQLPTGVFLMGNRRRDNLYIKSPGPRIKLYVNVPGLEDHDDPNYIKVTVLSGSIEYAGNVYEKNPKQHLNIADNSFIVINDQRISFLKRLDSRGVV